MNIFDVIKPIKLLSGSHADTGDTGQGCVMNVIAYLNGEVKITDSSPCVCFMVKPILIWFNDYLRDDERHLLIPYVERAMGSATEDKKEIERRAWLCVDMAHSMANLAAEYAAKYAKSAEYAKYAAKYAEYAKYAKYAAESAKYAESAESAKYAEYAADITESVLDYLDKALPKTHVRDAIVISRAIKLMELSA